MDSGLSALTRPLMLAIAARKAIEVGKQQFQTSRNVIDMAWLCQESKLGIKTRQQRQKRWRQRGHLGRYQGYSAA